MKKLFIGFTFILLFISCNKKYEPIKNYVETQGDTKSDLSFKGLEYRTIQIIKAKDSSKLIKPVFDKLLNMEIYDMNLKKYSDTNTNFYLYKYSMDKELESLKGIFAYNEDNKDQAEYWKKRAQEYLEKWKKDTIKINENIQLIKTTFGKGTYLEPTKKYIDNLLQDSLKILGYLIEVKYSIKNPFLNNVKQTITRKYLLNPNKDKVMMEFEKDTLNNNAIEEFIKNYKGTNP